MSIAVLVVVALVAFYLAVVLPARKRGNARYRRETDKRIDDALGTWAHESMIARDRKRGYGHHAQSRGVRE